METEAENQRAIEIATAELPSCSSVVLDGVALNNRQNYDTATFNSQVHHVSSSRALRNIEIDWREMDPYFSELSDCASFWTLINFTCDVIYSSLFVFFFILGQDVESMFFEGLLNHVNPILIYLILSLIINYGALRSLRCGREKCFLAFSISKALLFPITVSLLCYLVFCDVQEYFGTFWVSFVVIVGCYNLTAAFGLWSMFICNKYILVNEAAQKRIRKQAQQQRCANNERLEGDCQCGCANATPASYAASNNCNQRASSSRICSARKVGDSSCANSIILVCKPENSSIINDNFPTSCNKSSITNPSYQPQNTSSSYKNKSSRGKCVESVLNTNSDYANEDILSFGEEDEVLQISTVHKVMQEIRLLDTSKNSEHESGHKVADDGDSL